MRFSKAESVKKSNTELARSPTLFLDGFEGNVTIVVKNDDDDVVLIVPKIAITRTAQRATDVDLYTEITRGRQTIYKIDFSTSSRASACNQLTDRLGQLESVAFYGSYRRPSRHPAVDAFFAAIEREIPR